MRKEENPAGRERVARRENVREDTLEKREALFDLAQGRDVYTPLEPLRQHVLLDYRFEHGRPEIERAVFVRNVEEFVILVARSGSKSNPAPKYREISPVFILS